ncbi:DUF2304 domain-containing protein [Candidatus Saccharibacteria bacterium]|nr:DUF2304 domain-containing protein [Candidatus Saccharibacteria bacterium]
MTTLQIEMAIAATILFIIIITSIAKNRLSIKNSIAWLLLPIIFIIIAIFPDPLQSFAHWLGFETLSNFIFLVIIALLILICFFLTVSNSKQQDEITKLNQEISILKKGQNGKSKS